MASDAARASWSPPRLALALAWIFGCALYFYTRYTWSFVEQNDTALRDLVERLASVFALSTGER